MNNTLFSEPNRKKQKKQQNMDCITELGSQSMILENLEYSTINTGYEMDKINLLVDLLSETTDLNSKIKDKLNSTKLIYHTSSKNRRDSSLYERKMLSKRNKIYQKKRQTECSIDYDIETDNEDFFVDCAKFPGFFKNIKNIEPKMEAIILNTGNILYDINSTPFTEELSINLHKFGLNKVFNIHDFIDFYLFFIKYNDEDSLERNERIINYIPNYIKSENELLSTQSQYYFNILNKIGKGSYGEIHNCEIYTHDNMKINGKYVIKTVDLVDFEYDFVQTFFEYLNQNIIYEELNSLIRLNSSIYNITKIPKIFNIGYLKEENKIFIVMEKIDKSLQEFSNEIVQQFIDEHRFKDSSEQSKIIENNTKVLLNIIYQVSNLLDNLNSLPYLKFVHNDMKLNNIMLKNNQSYLIDFGISNLQYKGYQFMLSYPNNIDIKKNEIQYLGLNYYIFNNNIDIFHLVYNFYYSIFSLQINRDYLNMYFIDLVDNVFKTNICKIIYDKNNNLIVTKHDKIYLMKINYELFEKMYNNTFFTIKNIKYYSKFILQSLNCF